MKKHSLFFSLISKLGKIYFSDMTNKDSEYKRTVFYSLKEMGGVYIKFLQILCVTQNFTDGWAGPREFDVFNKVEQEPLNIYSVVKNQEMFSYIEDVPFACGSFAQLYKGKLKTGEVVAIKVLRPSIANRLKKDLMKLKQIVKIMSKFLPNNIMDYKEAFEEFSRNCILETDYEREIANMVYFGKMYRGHPYVVIPKVYGELSSRYVIIQEFIEGPTLADLITDIKHGESLDKYAKSITGSDVWVQIMIAGGEALRAAMVEDYLFGDPHPGNIILLKENKIAFIDFGIIASKPTSQEAFYLWTKAYKDILNGSVDYGNLMKATANCFCPDLVNALRNCSINIDTNNDFINSLASAMNIKANNMRGNNNVADNLVQNGHLIRVFTKFVDSKNALNLKLDMNNFQLLKAMQAYLSSITMIDNKYGNNKFPKIMLGAMEYALDYCERVGIKNDLKENTKYSKSESYELLLDTLTSLAEGDEFLFQNICERMFQ